MSNVRNKVVASVLIIYALRRVLSAVMLKIYALIAAGIAIAFTVSVPNIIENLLNVGLQGLSAFLISALVSTTFGVQIMSAVALCMALLLVRDSFRISSAPSFN